MSAAPPTPEAAEVDDEVREHDTRVRKAGLEVWIGAEPTFTRRTSQDPWWLWQAEGGDKEAAAQALIVDLAARLDPSATVFPVTGRHFPEEPAPRFCYGALWRRDGSPHPEAPPTDLEAPPHAPFGNDPDTAFLTVTPDPAVVEVNTAPAPDLATFLAWSRHVHAAAEHAGLSAVRFRYNGDATDSGGGGQLTLGGPTPAASPFFVHPRLLPSLLRYFNRHPSLSYWLAPECVGSASQGPRPDEGVRERFEELAVALDRLGSHEAGPEELWRTLAPLLVDCSGNAHRAELNIEKLWNPYLAGRGQLGLVEFRALRMEPTPERMTAVGALLRAICARVVRSPPAEPLVDWGRALHERFALPAVLAADLSAVLEDLAGFEVGLGPRLSALLLEPSPPLATLTLGDATLTVRPAREFWPLVGDVASQERAGARLVDSSTSRVEIVVACPRGTPTGRVGAAGYELPLSPLGDDGDTIRHVAAVRYRTFVPQPGLHPGLAAQVPLTLTWERAGEALELTLHGWIPGGGAYTGLPPDAAEAAARRRARAVVEPAPPRHLQVARAMDTAFTVDLRRLEPIH